MKPKQLNNLEKLNIIERELRRLIAENKKLRKKCQLSA